MSRGYFRIFLTARSVDERKAVDIHRKTLNTVYMYSIYKTPSSLWLCLRFDKLPLLALPHNAGQACIVLAQQRVCAYNDAAKMLGITPLMRLASARTLSAHITALERDIARENHYLQILQARAYRLSPTLCRYQHDSLLIEIGSCLRLAGGLTPLLDSLRHSCDDDSYPACWGLAQTPKAAWLLSHSETGLNISQPLRKRLAPLPLTLLSPLFARPVDALARAGFHHFGALLKLPTSALAERCGIDFSNYLQEVLKNPMPPGELYRPPSHFSETVNFDYEVKSHTPLRWAMDQLLKRFCRFLRQTQQYTAVILWQLRSNGKPNSHLEVRSHKPHSQYSHWYQLSCLQLDSLQTADGIDSIQLSCDEMHSLHTDSEDLFQAAQGSESAAHLLDRLGSRLGKDAISWLSWRNEHLPEFAQAVHPHRQLSKAVRAEGNNRPFWLLTTPQPLSVKTEGLYHHPSRKHLRCVSQAERIEDHWWQAATSRDYYTARCNQGLHYWVFYERRQRRWYLQGVFE